MKLKIFLVSLIAIAGAGLFFFSKPVLAATYCYGNCGLCNEYGAYDCSDPSGYCYYQNSCPPPASPIVIYCSCYSYCSDGSTCASGGCALSDGSYTSTSNSCPVPCTTTYSSCQNPTCGSWGGQYCNSCGSCGACDATCYVPPPPPPPPPPPAPVSDPSLCLQYFSCTDVRCANGSIAPGNGCYTPDHYLSDCTANCANAGLGGGTAVSPGGGTSSSPGGLLGPLGCPDECYMDDLRTNVGKVNGVCTSGTISTSHYCDSNSVGTAQTCAGGSYTCTHQNTGYGWIPSGNVGANGGATNQWVCDQSGNFYTCVGGNFTGCCIGASCGTPPAPPPGNGNPPPDNGNPPGNGNPPPAPPPPAAAWWQSKDADLSAAGNITSTIPSTCTGSCALSISGANSPGVPSYSGSLSVGNGSISSNSWAANTSYSGRRYDFDWYSSLLPTTAQTVDCSGGCTLSNSDLNSKAATDKAAIVLYTGNVTISGPVDLTNKKLAMLVNGTLNINGTINLTDGQGFFMAISKGDIQVGPSVNGGTGPALEGLFVTDGQFKTGAGSTKLYLRGSVVAWNGVSLQRDLGVGNSSTPAESFEYAPDLVLNFPSQLFRSGIVWREVAP